MSSITKRGRVYEAEAGATYESCVEQLRRQSPHETAYLIFQGQVRCIEPSPFAPRPVGISWIIALIAAVIATIFLFAELANAADISGPVSAQTGTLVELRATPQVAGSALVWIAATEIDYREFDLRDEKGALTASAFVFASPKPARVNVAVTEIALVDGKIVTRKTSWRVDVGDAPAPPGPNPPNPPTPPVPPAPVDRFGLTKIARDTAPPNADERAKIRSNYSTVASQMAAGTLPVNDARLRIRDLNRAAVGNPAADDHPWHKFAWAIGTRRDELENAGTLSSTADWVQAFSDIAAGLQ